MLSKEKTSSRGLKALYQYDIATVVLLLWMACQDFRESLKTNHLTFSVTRVATTATGVR
ncbi:hypothetical protein [Parendozoicomonas sp. Alg238-R29]|uniref:hypothetical protein n=1 Tax=Parendozoicomonas sp. Alg238-R29 TaxID=2993446 RepID=UPI00248DEB05|nr:hypothetical protein [Parendozoicomonas sp. Alg238-R29]